jgi:hypothetical protein
LADVLSFGKVEECDLRFEVNGKRLAFVFRKPAEGQSRAQ